MAFLSEKELEKLNFGSLGNNVRISDKAAIYGASNIFIGNNVRIDDFCIISAGEGGIHMSDYVHIACYVAMIGAGKISIMTPMGAALYGLTPGQSIDWPDLDGHERRISILRVRQPTGAKPPAAA